MKPSTVTDTDPLEKFAPVHASSAPLRVTHSLIKYSVTCASVSAACVQHQSQWERVLLVWEDTKITSMAVLPRWFWYAQSTDLLCQDEPGGMKAQTLCRGRKKHPGCDLWSAARLDDVSGVQLFKGEESTNGRGGPCRRMYAADAVFYNTWVRCTTEI